MHTVYITLPYRVLVGRLVDKPVVSDDYARQLCIVLIGRRHLEASALYAAAYCFHKVIVCHKRIEDEFVKMLYEVNTYSIEGNRLSLFNEGVKVAEMEAVAEQK